MRLKKREIPTSREINVQEGDGVKKREEDLTCIDLSGLQVILLEKYNLTSMAFCRL